MSDKLSREVMLKHFNEITKEYHREWTNEKYEAVQQIESILESYAEPSFDWVDWAFKLGHKLDFAIPWYGVDNRERIERAIDEWVKMKKRSYTKPDEKLVVGDPEQIAKKFHEAYEELAPGYGYKTRPETRKSWDELPLNNRNLMVATVIKVLSADEEEAKNKK